jgi:hypothetical protein
MTAAKFAKIAKVSKGTVLHWIRKGELPATQVRTERGPGYEIEMDDAQALEWLSRAGKLYTFSEGPTTTEAETPKSEPAPAADSALVEQLRGEVSFLRAELERRGEELRKRAEIEHLKDAFIQELVERTKALPAPEPVIQNPESPKRRRWWPFGGRDQ